MKYKCVLIDRTLCKCHGSVKWWKWIKLLESGITKYGVKDILWCRLHNGNMTKILVKFRTIHAGILYIPLIIPKQVYSSLLWGHNGRAGVSNHQPHHYLLNCLLGTDQRKHPSSASLDFVRGVHRWPMNSPHKWSVTRKRFSLDDVIMVLLSSPRYRFFG